MAPTVGALCVLVPPVSYRKVIHVSDCIEMATCTWLLTANFHKQNEGGGNRPPPNSTSTDWKQTKLPLWCSRQPNLLRFWFQCCSLLLDIQSSWLITQPIAASGQSQALYDSSQTTDRGAHSARLLFAHTPSSRAHHVCRLYRLLLCILIKTFFQMFWRCWEMDPGF